MNLERLLCGMALLAVLSSPVAPAQTPADQSINMNFEQVEIGQLVKIVSEATGERFVVNEAISGKKVTVVTPGLIKRDEVLPLFLRILEGSGYTVIEKDGVLHLVELPDQGGLMAPFDDGTTRAVGYVSRIFKLDHINALEIQKALQPLVRGGRAGSVIAFPLSNHLIVSDTAANLTQVARIITALDRQGASGIYEVVHLEHASARALANQIMQAVQGMESAGNRLTRAMQAASSGRGGLSTELLVVPVEQVNALILAGNPNQVSIVKDMIAQLDVESAAGRGRLQAIQLNYLKAEDAAKALNNLLARRAGGEGAVPAMALEPSIANNALLVDADSVDFAHLQELIATIDIRPKQVLVEVLIAEVTLGEGLDLGVEWATVDTPEDGATTVIGRSRPSETDQITALSTEASFAQGLTFALARGVFRDAAGNAIPRVPFLLNALSQNRDVNILSHAPLWAQDNTEASLKVVQNIPLLSSTIEGGSGTARDVIQNIERQDVGIKLTLTPRINPRDEVTLLLKPSIEAIVDQGSPQTPFTPTIAKREVETTVTVPDAATVIISGLIREDEVTEAWKVPLLGDIPGLGLLFRGTRQRRERTNLLIFVTPHIVHDMADADAHRRTWGERTGLDNSSLPAPTEP